MVADAYTNVKQTRINRGGQPDHPYQWTITVERTQENDQTSTYQNDGGVTEPIPRTGQHHPSRSRSTRWQRIRRIGCRAWRCPTRVDEPSEPGSVAGSGHEPGVDRNDHDRSDGDSGDRARPTPRR